MARERYEIAQDYIQNEKQVVEQVVRPVIPHPVDSSLQPSCQSGTQEDTGKEDRFFQAILQKLVNPDTIEKISII